METIINVLSKGEVDSPPTDDLKIKAAQVIKRLEKWPKLSNFLLKLFGRPEILKASGKKLKYLNTVLDQILEQFASERPSGNDESDVDVEIALFVLLLRYNFNHESVYAFYMAEIAHVVSLNKDDVEQTLRRIRIQCGVPPRKDMAYNRNGNSLAEDILAELDRRFSLLNINEGYIRPIDIGVPGNVFIPFIGLMVQSGLLNKTGGPRKFHTSLTKLFRTTDGSFFSLKTVQNQLGGIDAGNLEKCRALLLDMLENVEYKMDVKVRKINGPTLSE